MIFQADGSIYSARLQKEYRCIALIAYYGYIRQDYSVSAKLVGLSQVNDDN